MISWLDVHVTFFIVWGFLLEVASDPCFVLVWEGYNVHALPHETICPW